ncbi:MAG: S9 family peptidase [Synergistaceae bacterium]|nr:S9 family peptidase [Synergistaceae bacterium]
MRDKISSLFSTEGRLYIMRILFVLAVLFLVWPVCPVFAAMPPLLPMEDFFRNPDTAAFSISPDGTRLAFARPWQHRMNVYVREISTGVEKRITSATERDIAGFFWKGSDKIVYAQDSGGDENFHVYITDIKGGEPRDLTPFEKVKAGILDDLEDDPVHMLIEMNNRNPEIFDVYRCNINTGELELLAENPGNITGWMTDHDGKLRGAAATDGVNTSILYRTTEADEFRVLITTNFKETFTPVMFAYDNKLMYVESNLSRDKTAIYTFDPEKNQILDLIFEHDSVDVGGILHSKKRKVITGFVYLTDRRHYKFVDADREELQKSLEAFFPNYEVSVADIDDDERRVIVRTYSDRTRGTYYLFDRQDNSMSKLADLSTWLKEENMAPMKPITYTARDGLTIHGYLTLPVGVNQQNLPLVVIPHGGPSARDAWGFDSEAQFLANRGIAVLQVNFRGSVGYGKAFWQAGFKQWGRKMQDDVTDGVLWAVEQGIADRKRLAIYGGSYGGYAALAGATFTPELYACAVSYVGPSNIFTLLESIPPYWKPFIEMEYEEIGDPSKDKELLEKVSPVFHAERIKIPLFVAQGANDPRVNKAESDQIVEAVRKTGKEVVYMVKDNEGHGFQNEENRFDFYRTMEEFFRKHLGSR